MRDSSGVKPSRPPQPTPAQYSLAWYSEEEYRRLLEVAADRAEIQDTYAGWRSGAEACIKQLPTRPTIVHINVDELVAWCQERGRPLDAAARAEYVSVAVPG